MSTREYVSALVITLTLLAICGVEIFSNENYWQ